MQTMPQMAQGQAPWQQRPHPIRFIVASLLFLLSLFMLMAAIAAFIYGSINVVSFLTRGAQGQLSSLLEGIGYTIGGILGVIICGIGLNKTSAERTMALTYEPKNNPIINPKALGQPFLVKFVEVGANTSFGGNGSIVFEQEAIVITGTTPPTGGNQAVAIGATLVGGHLLGSALARAMRKVQTLRYQYSNVKLGPLRRLTLSLQLPGVPVNARFTVPEADGERLYRELAQHFPEVVQEYQRWLF